MHYTENIYLYYYIYTNDKTDFNNSYHRILPKFYTAQKSFIHIGHHKWEFQKNEVEYNKNEIKSCSYREKNICIRYIFLEFQYFK